MEEKRRRGHQPGVPNPNGGRKATGLKRVSFSVSCQPEELAELKKLAAASGKTTSRFLLDLAFNK